MDSIGKVVNDLIAFFAELSLKFLTNHSVDAFDQTLEPGMIVVIVAQYLLDQLRKAWNVLEIEDDLVNPLYMVLVADVYFS